MPRFGRLFRSALSTKHTQSDTSSRNSVAGRHSSPTAFLDGLRGVAAFIVLIHHISKDPFPWLPWGWGSKRHDVTQYYIFQLPVLRVIHSGPSMVAVFFVISGFALSYSPLKQIRRREPGSLTQSVASSAFRRVIRLYLPCIVTTFFMMLAVQLRMAPFPASRVREDNLILEIITWVKSLWKLLNPFDLSFTLPRYDDNLWTIPAELRGSMVLYITVIAVSRLRRNVRMTIESLITLWFFSYGYWDVCLFTAGIVLAEMHLEREEQGSDPLPVPSSSKPPNGPSSRHRLLRILAFIFALQLISAPLSGCKESWTYSWLCALTPAPWKDRDVGDRWIPTLGAPLLVYCVDRSRRLRSVFTASPSAYLGRISFGLYLVHGPVRYTAYHPVLRNVMGAMGLQVRSPDKDIEGKHGWLKAITWIADIRKDKVTKLKEAEERADTASLDWRFIIAVAITWSLVIPGIVILADIFTRTVDEPTVAFAKRVEQKYSDPAVPSSKRDDKEKQDRNNGAARAPNGWAESEQDREKAH